MPGQPDNRLAAGAVVALLAISLAAIIGGLLAAVVYGREIEGVVAIATGAVGGIVAIVIRDQGVQ